ncbi:sulfite exporter TauE/SafE family protein [Hymenobacter ginsengisoli]|uniref:Probable membrane transporter protein n=1 Tax=Hymenobacter ginsengisoli TaxID=1051626 RepID=A0ABP8QBM7_9BACT|nr:MULTISPECIES: sulfite exporter TauE/SafE family protein [unclassified Hymenobacter]MBO2031616.1 sulfite exporter TauE/SafE family protein [Hymenobacter sp. BT559]
MLHYLGYLAAIFIGLALGIMGGGGSILTMPVLVYLLGVSPVLSTAYSLFVVGSTALVGAAGYWRRGLVALPTALLFLGPSLATVFLTRRVLLPAVPQQLFMLGRLPVTKDLLVLLAFAVLMVAAAVAMIRSGRGAAPDADAAPAAPSPGLVLGIGAVVGLLTGLVGAGGGFLIIPALVLGARLPMKMAVGTSLAIIALNSLLGFVGDLGAGQLIDWPFLLGFLGFALGGIVLGSYLARFIPGARLKPAFGWFTLAMGTFILTKELFFHHS